MSVWVNTNKELPPLDEEVLILYKDKKDELKHENLYYGLARRTIDSNFHFEKWSHFTEYQGYCEVVFWAKLYDMPILEKESEETEQ